MTNNFIRGIIFKRKVKRYKIDRNLEYLDIKRLVLEVKIQEIFSCFYNQI